MIATVHDPNPHQGLTSTDEIWTEIHVDTVYILGMSRIALFYE